MDALDLIFDNYEDFLNFSEYVKSTESAWSGLQSEFCKTLTAEQKELFDKFNNERLLAYKDSQKEAFKCGVRAGAHLIFDLMDKDATKIDSAKKTSNNLYGIN